MTMNDKKDFQFLKISRTYHISLIVCLALFLGAILMLISSFNRLIKQHDEKLSQEICTLVSEKMSNSLLFMTDSAQNIADVISEEDPASVKEIYERLRSYRSEQIVGIGFIDEDRNIYLPPAEAKEFEKKELLKTAEMADPVSISEPYRSTGLGQPVITLFTDFSYGKTHKGYICITYLFSTLQEVAATESLDNDIEIWLMNARSANLIQCVGDNSLASGSWANAYLKMDNILPEDQPAFDEWYGKMSAGMDNASVSYSIGDTRYSQVFSRIDSMPGWSVVVRIPGHALSETMSIFRNYVLVFLFVFVNIMVVLISIMYISWKHENNILEQLSINDPLTGVLNRRAFEFASENMIARNKDATLIFFDLDRFKQVNDTLGHDMGDKLLISFSGILKDHFSGHGIVSRFGGDEFVVLTNDISCDRIPAVMESVKADVHSIKLGDKKTPGNDLKIGFSAGIACYPKDSADIAGLMKCADSALYKVKKSGRDSYRRYTEGDNDTVEK